MKAKIKEGDINLFAVAPGVWGLKDVFVNIYAIQNSTDNSWVLVDAGLKWSAPKIRRMAETLFGANSRPSAIILTHGHFDHVGSLAKLSEEWDVQVYAHHLEMPYLTGISSYPAPDPTVGGGLMAEMAFLYPRGPINIEDRIITLPNDGSIPGLPEWKFIHTPGHAPGHISLFRESDKVLISGDAFVTTVQESAFHVMLQTKKLSGPPKYFTCDWLSAARSVDKLAALEPEVVATGHGRPMRGETMRKSLHNLAQNFEKLAEPRQGRYLHSPALTDDTGVLYVPPKNINVTTFPILKILGVSAALLLTVLLFNKKKKQKRKELKNDMRKVRKEGKDNARDKRDKFEDKYKKTLEVKPQKLEQYKEKAKDTWREAKETTDQAKARINKLKEPVKEKYIELKEPVKAKLKDLKEPLKDKVRKFEHLKFALKNRR
ncbi:MAG: MBL fold metallo-hydrolase [Chitinophagaceae bacterium]